MKIRHILALLSVILFNAPSSGNPGEKDSMRLEILMNSAFLNDLNIKSTFINEFDITSKDQVILSSDRQLFLLGAGNMVPFGKVSKPAVSALAVTPDNMLMVVRNNELCYLDSAGNLDLLFGLPESGMGISAGKYVMYIYGRDNNGGKAIYVLEPGASYVKLIEVSDPISSVAEYESQLFFTNKNAVFAIDLATRSIKPVAVVKDGEAVRSIAVNPSNGRLFLSAGNKVYTVKNDSLVVVSENFGGTLKYYKGLMIFDQESNILVRLIVSDSDLTATSSPEKITTVSPAVESESDITQPAAEPDKSRDILGNEDIIGFVRDKFPDELIISIINNSEVNFDLSVDEMVKLSNGNVSSKVILAMKHAMENPDNK
jgi:hypothetical protein